MPSSGLGSRDPEGEHSSTPGVAQPGEAPSHTASGLPGLRQGLAPSLGAASFWSSSWGSVPGGGLSLGLSLSATATAAVAATRNLTGPLCAW